MKKRIGQIVMREGTRVPFYVIDWCEKCGSEVAIQEERIKEFSKATCMPMGTPKVIGFLDKIANFFKRLVRIRLVLPE